MAYLTPTGAMKSVPYKVEGENECPFCHHQPLVCPACREVEFFCTVCGKECATYKRWENDDPAIIVIERDPRKHAALDGATWSGHDVCNSEDEVMITRRVLNWLIETEVAVFMAIPIQLRVDTMSRQQLDRLAAVQRPLKPRD